MGTSVLAVVGRIQRCRTINLAQNGVDTLTPWLTALSADRDMCIGVYADVVVPGRIALGDTVIIEPT